MNTNTRAARHATTTAGPAESTLHVTRYENQTESSRLLERAARILLLLHYPLRQAERTGFTLLFERRLREAYRGGGQ